MSDELNNRIIKIHKLFFPLEDASITFLSLALAGEIGEFCNLLKKSMRGDFFINDRLDDFKYEVADIYIYLYLLARNLGIDDLDALCMEKLDIVEKRLSNRAIT